MIEVMLPSIGLAVSRAQRALKVVLIATVLIFVGVYLVPWEMHELEVAEEQTCASNAIADPLDLQHPHAAAIYLLGCVWAFFGLAMMCEEYFIEALQKLIETHQVPADVAGATFMAAGSSSPEVFAALVGVFGGSEEEEGEGAGGAGLATVAGSCVFNMLVIIGASTLISGSITMDWRPCAREVVFYLASIVLMLLVFADGVLTPLEAWAMVLTYVAYVLVNAFWERIVGAVCPRGGRRAGRAAAGEPHRRAHIHMHRRRAPSCSRRAA